MVLRGGETVDVRSSRFMSAYRNLPPAREVRRLVKAPLGAFGISVWCGLVVVTGALLALLMAYGVKPAREPSGLVVGTLVITTIVGVLLWLFDVPVVLVARIDEGVLEVSERRRIGRSGHRTFELRRIASVLVDEHGEDHVATYLQLEKKEKHAIFVTRIGDDARQVQAFVEEAIQAWHTAGCDASLE